MQPYSDSMKRIARMRAIRGNPLAKENIKRTNTCTRHAGLISSYKTDKWKNASATTMAELAVMEKLNYQEIRHAINHGYLTQDVFKKVFWSEVDFTKPSKNQLNMINAFHDILF